MGRSRQRVVPSIETDKQHIISSGTDESVHITISDPTLQPYARRLRNAKRKLKGVSVFANKLVEADSAAEPLIELWPTPKNKHLALLYYFFKLADNPNTIANFEYIEQLLVAGADVNARDRVGQTVLHEVARDWGEDVAKYLITKGADVHLADERGCRPLHVASRTDNDSVVKCLLDVGADINVVTHGELQTPLHYAARHDAADVIEVLNEYNVPLNPRDYKGRTPLLLAAELDRSVAASKLLEHGAKAGIIDKTGLHTLCAMVDTMPGVAYKALDQFHVTNRANRQQFFFLNYLEPDPDIDEASFLPLSVLGTVVTNNEIKLIGHPVIKEIIDVKWARFGRASALFNLSIYIVYLIAWTAVVLIYHPWKTTKIAYGAANTAAVYIAIVLFLYQVCDEILELYRNETNHLKYKIWRSKQIERDIQYVPNKLTEEKMYLESQIEDIKSSSSPYFSDAWNWFDWLTYLTMLITTVCVLTTLHGGQQLFEKYVGDYSVFSLWTSRLMCFTLILIWFKLFKFVRVFSFLGPFVVILANTISDVFKIMFVFVVFYTPTVAVFYHFYQTDGNSYFGNIRDTMFTVYRMLLVDDYGYDDIRDLTVDIPLEPDSTTTVEVKPQTWWTDVLVSYWLMFGAMIILNLFIALMSDTFQRVFDNAVEVALLERATIIVNIEEKLPERRKLTFLRYLKENCAPKESYYDDDREDEEDGEVKKYTEKTFELVKAVQEQVTEMRTEFASQLRSELAQQFHEQQREIKRVEDVVEHLMRVMEAQSKLRAKAKSSPNN